MQFLEVIRAEHVGGHSLHLWFNNNVDKVVDLSSSLRGVVFEPLKEIGYFKNKFSYLSLIKDDNIWMSVNPNEINTMRPFVNEANGNVLVLGLGMGYIAYMMSLKDEVKSITIVEKDAKIIEIFKAHLFNLFPKKSKIKIIHDDAFRYIENNYKFDYIFADLWHNPEDGIPMYLRFEKFAQNKNIKINYWLNTSLIAMKRRCLITIFEEYFLGYSDKDYMYAKNTNDQVINLLYNQIKTAQIETKEQLIEILK